MTKEEIITLIDKKIKNINLYLEILSESNSPGISEYIERLTTYYQGQIISLESLKEQIEMY